MLQHVKKLHFANPCSGMLVASKLPNQTGFTALNREESNESYLSTLDTLWAAAARTNDGRICSSHNVGRCSRITRLGDARLKHLEGNQLDSGLYIISAAGEPKAVHPSSCCSYEVKSTRASPGADGRSRYITALTEARI
jgi:hypothetical protein